MPLKRRALGETDTNARRGNAKKAKTAPDTSKTANKSATSDVNPKSKRWSTVSASANLDDEYKKHVLDSDGAFKFICICNPLRDSDADSNKADGPAGNQASIGKQASSNAKTCVCKKPAESMPSHPYTITLAGMRKADFARDLANLRSPDMFDMTTFNDHSAYGVLEVVQNLLLDFDASRRAGNWLEAWAVVEATALFMVTGRGSAMVLVEDSDMFEQTITILARMVLTMMADLERENMLGQANNVGWVVALYLRMIDDLRQQEVLEKGSASKTKTFKFNVADFDHYLWAFARENHITVQGVPGLEKYTDHLSTDLTMPRSSKDPWGWTKSLAQYESQCGSPGSRYRSWPRGKIGGDSLDLSTWTSAERKKHNVSNKDPLPPNIATELKKGLCLVIG